MALHLLARIARAHERHRRTIGLAQDLVSRLEKLVDAVEITSMHSANTLSREGDRLTNSANTLSGDEGHNRHTDSGHEDLIDIDMSLSGNHSAIREISSGLDGVHGPVCDRVAIVWLWQKTHS